MPETLPSVLIVADDRDLAGRLAAVVLRLGYRQTSVLPLTGAERAIVEGSVGAAGVTILGLSSASDPAIGIARAIAGQSPARALVAALALSGDEATRALAALTPLLPVVDVSEEPALAVAMRSAVQASRATAADRRRVWELQIVNEISEVIGRSLELEDVLAGALAATVAGARRRRRVDPPAERRHRRVRDQGRSRAARCGGGLPGDRRHPPSA